MTNSFNTGCIPPSLGDQLFPPVEDAIKALERIYKKKGFIFFKKGAYNLNIFGVRINRTISNSFDDTLVIVYKDETGLWIIDRFKGTTDPGLYYSQTPLNVNGCAILAPGQYRGMWKIGTHKGYPAFVQKSPCTVYRDNNKNGILDYKNPHTGVFGINGHRAMANNVIARVGKFSAGCQVWASPWKFRCAINIARKAAKTHSNSFTYTLFEEGDLRG